MKGTEEMLREYALRAISDDYENFDRVRQEVTGWAAKYGIVPDDDAIQRALKSLLCDGYAQAYLRHADPPGKAQPVTFSEDSLHELWFYVTPTGKQLARLFQNQWGTSEEAI